MTTHKVSELSGAMLQLATKRYPDDEPGVALIFFESDRRQAGLGALAERRRKSLGEVRRFKRVFGMQMGRVEYHFVCSRRARREFVPQVVDVPWDSEAVATEAVAHTRDIPARFTHHAVPFDIRDFRTQDGRDLVAATLKGFRRKLAQLRETVDLP